MSPPAPWIPSPSRKFSACLPSSAVSLGWESFTSLMICCRLRRFVIASQFCMQAKFSNVLRQHKFSAPRSMFTHRRSEEHTSELQSRLHLVCRLLLEKKIYRIVGTAPTLYDNVTMMKFLEKQSDKYSLIGLCMGEQGIISRVLGVRAGSVFTFGAIST